MKKIVTLLLALIMLMSFAACGGNDNEPAQDDSQGVSDSALKILDTEYVVEDYAICIAKDNEELLDNVDKALSELISDGSLQKVVDKYISDKDHDLSIQENVPDDAQELHMATEATFPPYEYYDGDDIVGIDAEIAGLIADKLGMKLIIDDMAFDAIIVSVQTGKSDMGMAGMTVTEERLESINFTTSYATGVQVVIVKEDSEISSVDDLFAEDANYTIGVQTGTTGDIYSTEDLEDEGLATISRYNKGTDAVQALLTGKIDCVIIDNEPAKAYVAAN